MTVAESAVSTIYSIVNQADEVCNDILNTLAQEVDNQKGEDGCLPIQSPAIKKLVYLVGTVALKKVHGWMAGIRDHLRTMNQLNYPSIPSLLLWKRRMRSGRRILQRRRKNDRSINKKHEKTMRVR